MYWIAFVNVKESGMINLEMSYISHREEVAK
jgi:hypothetical protein